MPVTRSVQAAMVTAAVPAASPRRPSRRLPLAVAALSLLLVLFSLVPPAVADTEAMSTYSLTAQCYASLRTDAAVASTRKGTIPLGTSVVASGAANGASWSTKCGGTTRSGHVWYRISSIGGKSVTSLYGVPYLYAATGLFKVVSVLTPSYAVCDGTALRTSPSLDSTVKGRLPLGAKVVSNGTRSGGAWSITCPTAATGSAWYRIISVDGQSVQSLYGVSFLWASKGLFAATMPAADPPSPSPSPSAKPSPSPSPTPSPAPSGVIPGAPWLNATPAPTASSGAGPLPGMTPIPMATPRPQQPNACFPPAASAPIALPTPTPMASPTPIVNGAPWLSASPSPSPSSTPAWNCVAGVDVSNWQGNVDWSQVAAAGYKFAFLKATEGGWYIDQTYASNRLLANANGIIIGAYDFAQPSTTRGQAEAEADFFVDIAMPRSGDLVPVLDLETTNGLSPANLQTWVTHWMYEVYARTGQRALIYTSPSFWSNAMSNSLWFALSGFPLWVAHWTAATGPTVPASTWTNYDWSFWQWTSSGVVPGISGRVDLDRFHYADLTPYRIR